jgi:hypothetical protein
VRYAQVRYGESVLNWYIYHFLPAGAFGVGLLAASGYLIAAWVFDVRLGRRRVWFIVGFQVLAYFVAQYVEFRSHDYVDAGTGEALGFWKWFHLVATSYVWIGRHERLELGLFGYAFRVLEIAAFAAGTWLLTVSLVGTPYCARCGRYRKTKPLATIPASELLGEVAAEDATEALIIARGQAVFDAIVQIAQAGAAETVLQQIADFPPKRGRDSLVSRLDLELLFCPGCMDATLIARITVKRPLTSSIHPLPEINVPVEFAERIAEPCAGTSTTSVR